MKIKTIGQKIIADRAAAWACLVGLLIALHAVASRAGLISALLSDAVFVAVLLSTVEIYSRANLGKLRHALLFGILFLAIGLYMLNLSTLAAWTLVIGAYGLLAWLDWTVGTTIFRNRLARWSMRLILAAIGGFVPVIASQVESRFADEEFFAFVQGAELAIFCLAFLAASSYAPTVVPSSVPPARGGDVRRGGEGQPEHAAGKQMRLSSWLSLAGVASAIIGLGLGSVVVYRNSFYTKDVPGYPGVTAASPFVCSQTAPDPSQASSEDVYHQMLAQVESNPRKGTLEFGMLALSTGDLQWAESFRDAVMAEARAGQFTEPANSVKSTQYEAALRAYYAPRMRAAFPSLFSDDDWSTLRAWFAAINRRALTVEWVDWMYALAFSKWPEGPYENQENGAGLLAILEFEGLSPAELSPLNQSYLERNRRGWEQRFRNTDDTFIYQVEWITNAYFQSLYWAKHGTPAKEIEGNIQRSFDWMLRQALPDGAPPCYNYPNCLLPVETAYWAANLEHDPQFVWWGARMLDWVMHKNAKLNIQPGAENLDLLQGASPTVGSCLIYGDSGLPNQLGPLAPDKVVLRDGWTSDSVYMLLNLRFSGWHRYKATNAIVSLYQAGPIVVEKSKGDSYGWLPTGRSLFRDKRIPRENLNGLLIERTGWSRVSQVLSGIGSQWAQDPPAYARVQSVNWLAPVDVSTTVIDAWHGWKHVRTVYLVHQGPIIVIDSAQGKGQAALTWHLVGEGRREEDSLWLREGSSPVRMALPSEAWQSTIIHSAETVPGQSGVGTPDWDVVYNSPAPGQVDLATAFLLGDWSAGQYETQKVAGGQFIKVAGRDKTLSLLQNDSGQWLQTPDLATDGRWALSLQQDRNQWVCFDGGTRTQVSFANRPASLRGADGNVWSDWEWDAGKLVLHNAAPDVALCLSVMK